MKKHEFQALRNKLYSAISSLGTQAEIKREVELDVAYNHGSLMLDSIDELGQRLGFLGDSPDESVEVEK